MTKIWTWNDYVEQRQKKEDESVAAKFVPYKHLGRGHLFPHLCRSYIPGDN